MRRSTVKILSSLGACVLSTSWALAQEADQYRDDFLTDKFSVAVGAFFPDVETIIRADAADGSFGTTISTESDLNVSDSDVSFDVNDFDGDMIQYAVGIEHDTFERVSLGLAFKSFETDMGIEKDDWLGNVDFKYSGPTLYFRLGFGALQ